MAEVDNLKTQYAVITNDIGRIKQDIKDIKISQEKFLGNCVSRAELKNLEDRMDRNEERQKKTEKNLDWAVKLVLGTVILAVIGLVITGGSI